MEKVYIGEAQFDVSSNSYKLYHLPDRPYRMDEDVYFKMFWTKWGLNRYLEELQDRLDTGWSIDIIDIKRHLLRFSITVVLCKAVPE